MVSLTVCLAAVSGVLVVFALRAVRARCPSIAADRRAGIFPTITLGYRLRSLNDSYRTGIPRRQGIAPERP